VEGFPTIHSRLAPTPSGFLHPGNAFSFVLTWLLTRSRGGTLRLRIDDLDAGRVRSEYLTDIFDTLNWLRLDYDAGPRNREDFCQHYSQLLRLLDYQELLERLREGGWLYACVCSRSQIDSISSNGLYPGTCRNHAIPFDTPNASWRIRVPAGTGVEIREVNGRRYEIQLDEVMGDFVVRRRDGLPSYQIASLADDLRYGCNCIVRGTDLIPSTAAQLYLARCLSKVSFHQTIFYHHPLQMDAQGNKLSKSAGAASLRMLRQEKGSPQEIYQRVAEALGIASSKPETAQQLLQLFHPSMLPSVR